jgi:hypothetical protein
MGFPWGLYGRYLQNSQIFPLSGLLILEILAFSSCPILLNTVVLWPHMRNLLDGLELSGLRESELGKSSLRYAGGSFAERPDTQCWGTSFAAFWNLPGDVRAQLPHLW